MRRPSALTLLLAPCAPLAPDELSEPALGEATQAATLEVPGSYATLELAIAAAQPGDVIRLGPGDFMANLTIAVPGLTLQGAGVGVTTLRKTLNIVGMALTVRDLSLVSDAAPFGVNSTNDADITLVNVEFQGYRMAVNHMGGPLVVERSIFRSNKWGLYVTGVRGRVVNSTFVNNTRAGVQIPELLTHQ